MATTLTTSTVSDSEPTSTSTLSEKSKRQIVEWLENQFGRSKRERSRFEREWFFNLSFYFGNQWHSWYRNSTGTYAQLRLPAAPPWRVRLVSNKIKPMVRKEIARLTKQRPSGMVVPASTDSNDVLAAISGEQVREHLWRELNASRKLRQAVFWTVLTGTGFIKDYWNPGQDDGNKLQGAINLDSISPFYVFVPDMMEPSVEGQQFIMHSKAMSAVDVKEIYGVEVKAETKDTTANWETQLLRGLGLSGTQSAAGSVQVKEAWVKQAPFLKNGGRVVWAGGEVISIEEELPYQYKDVPFTKFEHIETGRFYGQSFIVDLIPLQKELNRTRSQVIEAKNRMAKPQIIAAKGSVDPSKWTTEPGSIIEYQPGFNPPVPIPLAQLPGYVLDEIDRNQLDMNDIASQHEITKGQSPPGVEAATAISFLQEQDDSAIANALSSIEEGTERISRHILSHVVQFWDIPRMVRVTGMNGILEASELKGADVQNATDYRILEGSAVPRSFAAKQAFMLDLMKNGFIKPEQGLQYLNVAETDKLYEELQQDQRHAQRENLMMSRMEVPDEEQVIQNAKAIEASQQAVPEKDRLTPSQIKSRALQPFVHPINFADNHLAHIQGHEAYMKTEQFKLLHPVLQQLFEIHDRMHMQAYSLEAGVQFDMEDPRLVGFIKGHGAPPPMAVEDAQIAQGAQ